MTTCSKCRGKGYYLDRLSGDLVKVKCEQCNGGKKKDGYPCYGYHDFVPVDVLWLDVWGAMSDGKKAKVGWVVLACKCGGVKTVRASLRTGKSLLEEYQMLKKA